MIILQDFHAIIQSGKTVTFLKNGPTLLDPYVKVCFNIVVIMIDPLITKYY